MVGNWFDFELACEVDSVEWLSAMKLTRIRFDTSLSQNAISYSQAYAEFLHLVRQFVELVGSAGDFAAWLHEDHLQKAKNILGIGPRY